MFLLRWPTTAEWIQRTRLLHIDFDHSDSYTTSIKLHIHSGCQSWQSRMRYHGSFSVLNSSILIPSLFPSIPLAPVLHPGQVMAQPQQIISMTTTQYSSGTWTTGLCDCCADMGTCKSPHAPCCVRLNVTTPESHNTYGLTHVFFCSNNSMQCRSAYMIPPTVSLKVIALVSPIKYTSCYYVSNSMTFMSLWVTALSTAWLFC